MARYNRRDLFQHWVRKDQAKNHPCHHACCRGLRAHPEGYPVIRRNEYYRNETQDRLAEYYDRHQGDTARDEAVRSQVLAEMQRRDEREARRQVAEERRRDRYSARRSFRREERERLYAEADAATIGYMLNKRGRDAGIDPKSLFTGPESRARKYASRELLDYWEHHPRPTEAYFEGRGQVLDESTLGKVAVRSRVTTEEAYWRDRFEREAYDREAVA